MDYTDWRTWLHGLVAAFIGSTAGAFGPMLATPAQYNVTSLAGFRNVLFASGLTGVVAAMAYLKQSPLPPAITTVQVTKTVTVTGGNQEQTDAVADAATKQPIQGKQ